MRVLILAKHVSVAVGGIEIQCDLIARELRRKGHAVTYGAAGGALEGYDAPYRMTTWLPGDDRCLWRLVAEHRPDIVYFRHNKVRLRRTVRALTDVRVPVVFAASSLQDVTRYAYHRSNEPLTPRRAASIAWQMAKSRWNWSGFRHVAGAISLNPDYTDRLPVPRRMHINDVMSVESLPFEWPRPFVAWVAQLKPYKHPEEFVELARRCNNLGVDFLMVGGRPAREYEWIAEHRGTPSSFHYLGPMSLERVNGFLAASLFLVHTCDPEGFGNNFIQAWLQSRPTLSLRFDPAGIIRRERIGEVPGSMDGLERAVRQLVASDAEQRAMGERAHRHATANYDIETNVARLESFLASVAGSGGRA